MSIGKPAARVGDLHICPMTTGTVVHVGGKILPPGEPTVLIGDFPAARSGDKMLCTGASDNTILSGSATVLIGDKPAARMLDSTSHGGAILLGDFTVLIG